MADEKKIPPPDDEIRNSDVSKEIFNKNTDRLSDMEKLMVDIIEKNAVNAGTHAESKGQTETVTEAAVSVPKPVMPVKSAGKANGTAQYPAAEPAVSYTGSKREKKISDAAKRKRKNPVTFILILCIVLVVGAIIANAIIRDRSEAAAQVNKGFRNDEVVPVANDDSLTSPGVIIMFGDAGVNSDAGQTSEDPGTELYTEDPAITAATEHGYELFVEDVSWTEARQRCADKGGHLVVINSDAELAEIITMAEQRGVYKVWIGCHRENNTLVWEREDQEISFTWPWGAGEPSYYDSGDKVSEDFIMLWYLKGWCFNDSRDNPVADYPNMYSGQIAYICEYE